ncbi:hypothetical protein FA13DRAFT_1910400 [Coprinellus micaceus]|uniref:Uncharacterized protein n=1 Tax=Coprinellus micaceus TaxID=71717 RepID=A0A4Y7TPB5_COPMI|nr:hypothetical protein FA13DRAFT_1910400 [Coprinellus micaceus]
MTEKCPTPSYSLRLHGGNKPSWLNLGYRPDNGRHTTRLMKVLELGVAITDLCSNRTPSAGVPTSLETRVWNGRRRMATGPPPSTLWSGDPCEGNDPCRFSVPVLIILDLNDVLCSDCAFPDLRSSTFTNILTVLVESLKISGSRSFWQDSDLRTPPSTMRVVVDSALWRVYRITFLVAVTVINVELNKSSVS